MLDKLFGMVESFKQNELVFWYNGPISQFLVVEIGEIIKKSVDEASGKKMVNRIFSILVEQMQNIIKYSVQRPTEQVREDQLMLSSGLIAVGIEEDHYAVVSGNTILNSDISRIRDRLDRIIAMDSDQLKDYYKAMRKQEPDERSLGAGLGFIEMARRASKPLEYRLKSIDRDHSFFSLKALVSMEP